MPLIDAREILRVLGGAAFTRGRALATEDHIPALEFDPESGVLSGELNDDGDSYALRVELAATNGRGAGEWAITDVGEDDSSEAKVRAAALLIRSNALHKVYEETAVQPVSSAFAQLSPAWRTDLTQLVTGGRSAEAPAEPDAALGLQFEVHDANVSSTRRLSTSVEQRSAHSRPRLGIRPVIVKDNGRVSRGSLRWNSISFKTYGHQFDPPSTAGSRRSSPSTGPTGSCTSARTTSGSTSTASPPPCSGRSLRRLAVSASPSWAPGRMRV